MIAPQRPPEALSLPSEHCGDDPTALIGLPLIRLHLSALRVAGVNVRRVLWAGFSWCRICRPGRARARAAGAHDDRGPRHRPLRRENAKPARRSCTAGAALLIRQIDIVELGDALSPHAPTAGAGP
jgi:hypothetical protein